MPTKDHPTHLTAIHEAGHATVATELGVPFHQVELWKKNLGNALSFGGRLLMTDQPATLTKKQRLDRLAVFAAGDVAVRLFRGPAKIV